MNMITVQDKSFEKYIDAATIDKAIEKMASQINKDYQGEIPLFMAVLNGSFMFASDLLKKIEVQCGISFIKLASYEGTKTTEVVQTLIGVNESVKNRRIIIIEDIIDTGITLDNFLDALKQYNPLDVKIATLLFKPKAFTKKFNIDYIGIEIPNDFIIGYGLDYNGLCRNLPDIYKIIEK